MAKDPIGLHAQRRITDTAMADDPREELLIRARNYIPGDTDLAWTRLTPWRTVLAAMLDRHVSPVESAQIGVGKNNPSGVLLASWLKLCLNVEVTLSDSAGPGITDVVMTTAEGDLSLSRIDGAVASLSAPGVPDSTVALARRSSAELLAEELRRLTPDAVYGRTLAGVENVRATNGD